MLLNINPKRNATLNIDYEKIDGYSVINFRDNGLDLKKMDTNFWNVQNLSW
jgi:hypothetical protein